MELPLYIVVALFRRCNSFSTSLLLISVKLKLKLTHFTFSRNFNIIGDGDGDLETASSIGLFIAMLYDLLPDSIRLYLFIAKRNIVVFVFNGFVGGSCSVLI